MSEPITLEDVRRIDAKPGDVLWVKTAARLSAEHAEWIRHAFKEHLPGVRVFVGDEDTDICVIRSEAA